MRKLVLILLLVIPFLSFAQKGNINLGINTGVNFTNLNYNNDIYIHIRDNFFAILRDVKPDLKISSTSGLDIQYYLSNKVSVQSGVLHAVKGINIDERIRSSIYDGQNTNYFYTNYYFNSTFEYIQLPILMQYSIGDKVQLISSLGFSASILVNRNIELKPNALPYDLGFLDPESIDLSSIIYSAIIEETLLLNLSDKTFFKFSLNYSHDLTAIFTEENVYRIKDDGKKLDITPIGLDANSKFRTLSVKFGLVFNLKSN